MLVLIGGSGSGKSTIEKLLCENYGYEKIVSYTTRSIRDNEVDGVDYHYISETEFKNKQNSGFFAEVGVYNGWHYGIAKEDCTNEKVAVLTPHGLRQVKKIAGLDVISIYIDVPRRDRLIKILQRNDNIEEAKRRDASDVGQFDGVEDEVDHIINNDNYKNTAESMARQVDFMYKTLYKHKTKIRTILCDIDETVNNLTFKIIEKYNKKYGDTLSYDEITQWEIKNFIKPECEDIFAEFCTDEFLYSLDVQPDAENAIKELMKNYNFFFVSAKHPSHVAITDRWLKAHFSEYDTSQLVICQDKSVIDGDVLIDDCLNHIITDKEKVRYNIIFDKPWNRTKIEDDILTFRAYNWNDILDIIKKIDSAEEDSGNQIIHNTLSEM